MSLTKLVVLVSVAVAVACAKGNGSGNGNNGADGGDPTFGGDSGTNGCARAIQTSSSVGCDYYAVHMESIAAGKNGCFAVFVANTSDSPTGIHASFGGQDIDLGTYAKLPRGAGLSLTYADYDPIAGLAPGDVAVLFLAGPPTAGTKRTPADALTTPMECPVIPSRSTLTQRLGTGLTAAFHVTTDAPVVAYQMMPYGGGNAAVTGASLLLPTSAWGKNYLAVNAYTSTAQPGETTESMDLVAEEDATSITILPKVAIQPGGTITGAPANKPVTYTLNKGDVLQLTQGEELTGSPIQSDKPIGLFGGQPCLVVGAPFCDHAEQQIPPVGALGHEYMGVTYRQRSSVPENPPWRLIGAVNGTTLTYSNNVGGPTSINQGDVLEFSTPTPFVVSSQDADHPFILVGYMTGAQTVSTGSADTQGYGDADFVRAVPTDQYLDRYVFFTDPTYPETNLVITRKRENGGFADVTLDCAGTLTGWTPIDANHEWTRIDLVRHDFKPQNGCDNGRHEMKSANSFGLTVWGWGGPETKTFTGYVSYGYPAGENVKTLTTVVVPPTPH